MRRAILFLIFSAALAATASAYEAPNEINAANVIRLMNEHRAAAGLPPLHANDRLELAARDRMRDMEEAAYWSHRSPDGVSPFVWLAVRSYRYQSAGENLAAGFETAKLLVESWMESPGHRANILSSSFDECGIAVLDGATTGPMAGKSIVVLFARQQPLEMTRATRR